MSLTADLNEWYIKNLPGMNNKVEDLDLQDKWVELAQNARFEDEPGSVDKREPVTYLNSSSMAASPVTGLYRFYTSGGTNAWVGLCGTSAYTITDAGVSTAIRSGLTTGKRCSFATYKDLLICSNGYDNIWVWDGASDNVTWELGACKAVLGAAGGSLDSSANYYYAVTFDTDACATGAVSNTVATTGTNFTIELSNIPLGPIATTNRRIYRTEGGGSTLKLLTTISDNTTTTYSDTIADSSLGVAYPTVTDDMPKGAILKIHRERLFISGDPSHPNWIYYSNVYLPHYIQQTTNIDYMEISPDDGDEIMGIPIQLGVMVCVKRNTIRKLHITSPVSGADPETWYADDPIAWIGSPSMWSITQTPSGVVFLGWDHWYIFDGGSTAPIMDEFDTGDILAANYEDVVGFYHGGNFLASYTDKSSAYQAHNRGMVYNFKRQTLSVDLWASTTVTGSNCYASRSGDDEVGDLYYGDSVAGYVLKERDTDSSYQLRTKSECNAGTLSDIFVGGTEASPYMEIGDATTATTIPNDIVIFWDDETTTPGTGWVEITGYEDRLLKISTTALTTAAGSGHTHTLTGTIAMWYGTVCNAGDGNAAAIASHYHTVSDASGSSTPLPRNVKYRMFKASSCTTTEFPDGAIVMWDQATAPTGWQFLTGVGYYVCQATTGLATVASSTHSHAISVTTSAAIGGLAESDTGANGPSYTHTHTITGTTAAVNMDTWEVDYVEIAFIKKIGESDTWDGVDKYCYALYASSGTPTGWSDVSSTYANKMLKIGTTSASTGAAANFAHTHASGSFTSGNESANWGNNGYHATIYSSPHTHSIVLTGASGSAGTPATVTFRMFRKVLGQMKDYNTAISTPYTTGTWTSPSMEIKADALLNMYWNEDIEGSDNVQFYTRTGTTQALCEAAAWSAALSDPNGSAIASTANVWLQYKVTLTATDSTVTNPRIYFTNGYIVKYEYHTGAVNAETSVNFTYDIGFRNFDTPGIDKIFKKIISRHSGTQGSFTINWETENASGSFVVSLSDYPEQWDSYFPSTAMGKQIDLEVIKNDLYSFRISELKGLYSPYSLIV